MHPSGTKGNLMSVQAFIENQIETNDIVIFMKGTPAFPQCGFSGQMAQVFDYLGVDYRGINVLGNDELHQGIKDYTQWPTVPQIYVKREFIGGCDIVREMFQNGELQDYLNEKSIPMKGKAEA